MLKQDRLKRKKKIRSILEGTSDRPRVSVYRSNKYIYAQIIDDQKGVTLVEASDRADVKDGKKLERAAKVGEALAEKALKAKITKVVFDRGGYPYHGRVKAIAEALRAKGVQV